MIFRNVVTWLGLPFSLVLSSTQAQSLGFDAREATIDSVQQALFSGAATCREVTLSFLARIQALNPHVNAIISLNPNALKHADLLDDRISRGNTTGSLFCIPVLLKDNFDTHDMKTTGGCLALAASQPKRDAPTVRALRDAGAVVLGKTNLHELALEGLSVSSVGGQTLNPYDLNRTPGGSSGGSGAAIAASLAVFATGTDTMNSLRSPASANSLFSVRPTRGLITRSGVIPISHTQDVVGPMGRCTKDIAIALTVMASAALDPRDNSTLIRPQNKSNIDYAASLAESSLNGLRLGLIWGFFNRTVSDETNPVTSSMLDALHVLRGAGVEIVEIEDPMFNSTAIHKALDTQRYEFREEMNRYLQEPNFSASRPRTFEELYKSGKFLVIPRQYEQISTALQSSTSNHTYHQVRDGIANLTAALQETFNRYELDAMIYPEQASLVVHVGSPSQTQRNGILAALTGSPVVTVPAGFSAPTVDAPVGVPIGMEILGKMWDEQKLLQIAYHFEQLTHVRRSPKLASKFVEVGQLNSVPYLTPDRSHIPDVYPIGVLRAPL